MNLSQINLIQLKLIKESNLNSFTWIAKYSAKFRNIVEGGVETIDQIQVKLYNL